MCKYCEGMKNLESNKKKVVILNKYESEFTKVDETIMEKNHNDDCTPYAFITHKIVMNDNRTWSRPIYIQYCPFCGDKLY